MLQLNLPTRIAHVENIKSCIDADVPIVSGSTGWLKQFDEIKSYCKEKNGMLFICQ